jgi:hypothetical protein
LCIKPKNATIVRRGKRHPLPKSLDLNKIPNLSIKKKQTNAIFSSHSKSKTPQLDFNIDDGRKLLPAATPCLNRRALDDSSLSLTEIVCERQNACGMNSCTLSLADVCCKEWPKPQCINSPCSLQTLTKEATVVCHVAEKKKVFKQEGVVCIQLRRKKMTLAQQVSS